MPATAVRAGALPPLVSLPPHLARQVWRGGQLERSVGRSVPTGQAALDAELPGGGWPTGGLTELLLEQPGIGELRLLAPALRALTAEGPQARYVALIAPPYFPLCADIGSLGIALERVIWIKTQAAAEARHALWAVEQTLKHEGVGAILLWLPKVRADALRRLQVLAQDGSALAFLLRPASAAAQSSPAPLRILCRAQVLPEPAALRGHPVNRWTDQTDQTDQTANAGDQYASWLQLEILKRRGPVLAAPLRLRLPLEMSDGWPQANFLSASLPAPLSATLHDAPQAEPVELGA